MTNSIDTELENYLSDFFKGDVQAFYDSSLEATAVRVNTLKISKPDFIKKLEGWNTLFYSHPFNPTGLILDDEPVPLSHTLSFFTGEFTYQGISSQLPVLALDPQPGETVLDLAASPGSKSTQIAAHMQNKGRLVLVDPSLKRQQSLLANLARMGTLNDIVLKMPGQQIGRRYFEFFDRALVDAPCSALSKLPGQMDRGKKWSFNNVKKLINIQYPLLVSAIKAVKPGGTLVYSTCTLTVEENEQLVDYVLKKYPVEVVDIQKWDHPNISDGFVQYYTKNFDPSLAKAKRILPGKYPMDAFFIVKLRKTDSIPAPKYPPVVNKIPLKRYDDPEIRPVLQYICDRWGIDLSVLKPYHYNLTQKKLWLVQNSWESIPMDDLVKAGLNLAYKRGISWKLSNSSVQFLKNSITKNIISLDDKQMTELFFAGKIKYQVPNEGYYVLNYDNENIASISVVNGILKTDRPHVFKLTLTG